MIEEVIPNHIYQMSTINALVSGLYDGCASLKKLLTKGDFGIGTFKDLDGELTLLDGIFYRTKPDGSIYVCSENDSVPFAVITKLENYNTENIEACNSYEALKETLDGFIDSKNIFYAFYIKGSFNYVKTRTVVKQSMPYKPMAEVVKNQPVFNYENVKGHIVGFRCPDYVEGLNVPGYHFHFLSDDKKFGGHVSDISVKNAEVFIQNCLCFRMELPQSESFYSMKVENRNDEISKVEK
ncbi:acetolactate decarboxylase [Clostridium acetobutylicum]|uniref:Alpha-acetolactate decarboxylase n=1 Tax=Clostridium acetobutylicum (strain ATCC 824 / DSM 792 / JCM 1419 / IAM 19013 / LMG 5710 / NBRC 13948 / NRRL B-527 / VKM B-1787 / 2291 / W) TaxID=272562 RepID=Q97EY8_CLOAB|nr:MULTISPECIES: acetolactate decarboxylase [Clostridium]AAK80909.1 Alpha-acetolactate decarboxylase [Clostridium acetobutylicum ATCC 824]ADZ22011.1 Alpha-acetolactate decarboxylase [Clostridium acetobutylicum EA 2018]AEI32626.1 Alpha-acetolactate decarboxylase [Clostridium acetobutylicum DSM 1731]AWV78679.1 acetolactate decarboxylase [Clostridium acetobutylicum]KHD37270.1 alpha-acetolactate decarboxylase [Clostridium acetobutylicum]